jgi:hypothetical protein
VGLEAADISKRTFDSSNRFFLRLKFELDEVSTVLNEFIYAGLVPLLDLLNQKLISAIISVRKRERLSKFVNDFNFTIFANFNRMESFYLSLFGRLNCHQVNINDPQLRVLAYYSHVSRVVTQRTHTHRF